MAQGCLRYVGLEVNCGFARTAIRELTNRNKGNSKVTDTRKRASEFQTLFESNTKYCANELYFNDNGRNGSQFDRDCTKVLNHFHQRWNPKESRQEYEKQFSMVNWKALPVHKKQNHTMANCEACRDEFYHHQEHYPQGPYFKPEPVVSVDVQKLHRLGERKATRKVLAEMNASFSEAFNTSFTTSAVEHGKEPIQRKPTANERKRKLRAVYRQCRDKENEARRSTAAISVLTEDHSVRSYTRKRKLQSFQTPPSKRARPKSHSPNFTNATWDKERVLEDLQSHPAAPPPIKWQIFATQHGVPGKNCGQVVKEFAVKSGIDISRLEGQSDSNLANAQCCEDYQVERSQHQLIHLPT